MSAHIGVTGLAVMGANLARNLARNGFTVALHNRTAQRTHDRWVTFVTSVDVPEEVAARLGPTSPELTRTGWFAPGALPDLHGDAVAPLRLAGVLPPV